jgi:hypothetical protein
MFYNELYREYYTHARRSPETNSTEKERMNTATACRYNKSLALYRKIYKTLLAKLQIQTVNSDV